MPHSAVPEGEGGGKGRCLGAGGLDEPCPLGTAVSPFAPFTAGTAFVDANPRASEETAGDDDGGDNEDGGSDGGNREDGDGNADGAVGDDGEGKGADDDSDGDDDSGLFPAGLEGADFTTAAAAAVTAITAAPIDFGAEFFAMRPADPAWGAGVSAAGPESFPPGLLARPAAEDPERFPAAFPAEPPPGFPVDLEALVSPPPAGFPVDFEALPFLPPASFPGDFEAFSPSPSDFPIVWGALFPPAAGFVERLVAAGGLFA